METRLWYFFPTSKAKPMSAEKLRAIADKLDKKNKDNNIAGTR